MQPQAEIRIEDMKHESLSSKGQIKGRSSDPTRHFRLAQQVGMMPSSLEEIKTNQDIVPLRTHRFRLERTLINWIALTAFHSRIGTRLFYD